MNRTAGKRFGSGWKAGAVLVTLLLLTADPATQGFSQPAPPQSLPKLDFNDFGGYMRQLQTSDDPRARVILREIARGPADLEREKGAAHREGIAIVPREMQRPLPPPEQNAAPLYDLFEALERTNPLHLPDYAEGMSSRFAYTSEQLNTVRKLLHDRRDIMDLSHWIGDRRQCVFRRDWSKGQMMLFSEYPMMRHVSRLLKTESYLLARQGRYDEAVEDEVRGLRVAEHADSDPSVISYLVGVSCEGIALSGMKDILYLAGPNVAVDRQVERAVAIHRSRISLRNSLAGETTFALSEIETGRREGPRGMAEVVSTVDNPVTGPPRSALTAAEKRFFDCLLDAQAAYHLHRLRRLVTAAVSPVRVRRAVFARIDDGDPESPVALLGNTVLGVYTNVDQQENRRHAQEQVTLAGAALLEQRARTGHLPNHLPVGFIDPFTGRPLQCQQDGKGGFVVSSVGPGGALGKLRSYRALFQYPPPAPEPVPLPSRGGWPH